MEKFGIFDLLDTLSAIAERDETATETGTQDATALTPPYTKHEAAPANHDAISGFLGKHDAISRKIDEKKKQDAVPPAPSPAPREESKGKPRRPEGNKENKPVKP